MALITNFAMHCFACMRLPNGRGAALGTKGHRAVPFEVPSGRGITRLASDVTTGRCAHCGRAFRRRLNGNLIAHDVSGHPCPGGRQPPAEDVTLASWLPVRPG